VHLSIAQSMSVNTSKQPYVAVIMYSFVLYINNSKCVCVCVCATRNENKETNRNDLSYANLTTFSTITTCTIMTYDTTVYVCGVCVRSNALCWWKRPTTCRTLHLELHPLDSQMVGYERKHTHTAIRSRALVINHVRITFHTFTRHC
jgi:hypothetical protein